MSASRIASFLLWSITAFILIAIGLKYAPGPVQTLPAVSKAQEVNFSPENMHALLAPPSTPVSPASTSTHIDVQLRGIIYSSSKEQSRALIQTEADKVKPFAIDSQLANGARVLQIKPRSVIYEHQGQQREVSLPIRP